MKAKIDLEKFICSMLNDSKTNAGYVHAKSIERALKEQGMEYKDGEIVKIDTIDTSSPRWAEIVKECKHDALEQAKKITITIPKDLKGTDPDGGVVGEKGEQGETPFKEYMENLKKRIEDNQLGCIVQRLDRIIELLQSAILILPKEPYVPPIIYKRPLDPDPNVLGGWTTTANTFGSDYDIDTDKIKQDETNKPKS